MAQHNVKTQAELDAAIKALQPGDTVMLAAGTYDKLDVRNVNYATAVKFVAADAANKPVIKDLFVYRATGVSFESLTFGRQLTAADFSYTKIAQVIESNNISFSKSSFTSTGNVSPYNGTGLFVRSSNGVTVADGSFTKLAVGMATLQTQNIKVTGNMFRDLFSDGAQFAAVSNALIDKNTFTDFPSSQDTNQLHPDAIQFWTSPTDGKSTDVTISNNIILPGTGNGSQGIFINNEMQTDPHLRFTIRNNLLYNVNTQYHGISVTMVNGLTVEGNTVLSPAGDKNYYMLIRQINGGRVANNVVDQMPLTNNTGLEVVNNIVLSDTPAKASMIPNLNIGQSAQVQDLLVTGFGYVPTEPLSVKVEVNKKKPPRPRAAIAADAVDVGLVATDVPTALSRLAGFVAAAPKVAAETPMPKVSAIQPLPQITAFVPATLAASPSVTPLFQPLATAFAAPVVPLAAAKVENQFRPFLFDMSFSITV